ncbi:MAG: glycosyltransferase family 4 protein [Verrucomicrobiae bacterium]|nr:glycosyltransferase family 4 protein [Verrucomicrobiae bacterium]
MRVTHVITRLILGGAQENTLASVLGLRQSGEFDADLITGPALGPEGSLLPPGPLPPFITVLPQLVRPIHPWFDVLAFARLVRLLRARQPHIVHTHSGKAGVLGRLAARRARVPVIVHTLHGPSFGPFQGALANQLFLTAERVAARVTTHFVVVADALRAQYLAAGIGQPEQYTKILSGFDLAPFLAARNDPQQRARWGLAPEDFVVGKIARLFKLKGHEDLFNVAPELVRRCPRMKFLLVGDGPWRGRFERRASDLGLRSHFVFAGLQPPTEIPALVGIMDAVVHLSRREGLPRALAQALAAGRPVVAYDCDGAREVCRDGETGFLLAPGDRAGLQTRLLELAGDAALRARLGERGRALVREQFPVERMVQSLQTLYRKLAADAGISSGNPARGPHPA